MRDLSEFAKDYGLKTEWKAFSKGAIYSDLAIILEICERIEEIEKVVNIGKKIVN